MDRQRRALELEIVEPSLTGDSAMPEIERIDGGDDRSSFTWKGVEEMATERTLSNAMNERTINPAPTESVLSDFLLLIDGKLVKGAGTLDVINPATGQILAAAPRANRAQLDQAVAAAK